jgi:hypothetical protein
MSNSLPIRRPVIQLRPVEPLAVSLRCCGRMVTGVDGTTVKCCDDNILYRLIARL